MGPLRQTVGTLLPATVAAGLIAYAGWRGWESQVGHANIPRQIGAVFVPAGIAAGFYWGVAMWRGVPAAREITAFTLAKFKR
jgi:hypothetical protein